MTNARIVHRSNQKRPFLFSNYLFIVHKRASCCCVQTKDLQPKIFKEIKSEKFARIFILFSLLCSYILEYENMMSFVVNDLPGRTSVALRDCQ